MCGHCVHTMIVYLINPSHVSFGIGVITPRWLYVLAAATPASYGAPRLIDETLESFDPEHDRPLSPQRSAKWTVRTPLQTRWPAQPQRSGPGVFHGSCMIRGLRTRRDLRREGGGNVACVTRPADRTPCTSCHRFARILPQARGSSPAVDDTYSR